MGTKREIKMEWVCLGKSFDYDHFDLGHCLREIKEKKHSKLKGILGMMTKNGKSSNSVSGKKSKLVSVEKLEMGLKRNLVT